jgi:hypothetical protein
MDFCEEKYKNNSEYRNEYLNYLISELIKNNELFENFDTTNVTYLFYSCYGIYGLKIKELSTQILKEFVEWAKKKPNCYICNYFNDEPMFHQYLMEQLLKWCDKKEPHENNFDEILEDFKNKKNEIMYELYSKIKEDYDKKMNEFLSTPRSNFYGTNGLYNPSFILKWYIVGSIIGYIIGVAFKYYTEN